MKKLFDYKLIIDFNNLKNKKAISRMEDIKAALLAEDLSEEDFEIRNTKEEDHSVEWLVDKNDFFLGIKKKPKE